MWGIMLGLGAAASSHLAVPITLELTKFTHTNVHDVFDRHIPQSVSPTTVDPPTCVLSGRVKAVSTLSIFHDFIGKNAPEMSIKEDQISDLVDKIHQRNYSEIILSDSELPHLAIAGFANGQLSLWEISNILIWHQRAIDFPNSGLTIVQLLDEQGNWMPGVTDEIIAKNLFVTADALSSEDMEKLRSSIQKLPLSEQVRAIFQNPPSLKAFQKMPELSLGALRILYHIVSGNDFGLVPRLGVFSKDDIAIAEIFQRSRLFFVPFPGVASDFLVGTVGAENLSLFSVHDLFHSEFMHMYSPQLVDASIELIDATRKMNGNAMPDELWRLADFGFGAVGFKKGQNANEGFTAFYEQYLKNNIHAELFKWNMILHIQGRGDHWKTQYGIDIDTIPELKRMNELAKLSEPFLKENSLLGKIYLLQNLQFQLQAERGELQEVDTDKLDVDKIKSFLESQPPVPKLKVDVYDRELWGEKKKVKTMILVLDDSNPA